MLVYLMLTVEQDGQQVTPVGVFSSCEKAEDASNFDDETKIWQISEQPASVKIGIQGKPHWYEIHEIELDQHDYYEHFEPRHGLSVASEFAGRHGFPPKESLKQITYEEYAALMHKRPN